MQHDAAYGALSLQQQQQVADHLIEAIRESLPQRNGKPILDVLYHVPIFHHTHTHETTSPEHPTAISKRVWGTCQLLQQTMCLAFAECIKEHPDYSLNILHDLTEVLSDVTYRETQRRCQPLEQENAYLREKVLEIEIPSSQTSKQLAELIVQATDMLIVVLDREGHIVHFNKACETSTGYTADEVIGLFVWDMLIPPEQIEGVKKIFYELALEQMPNRYENHWIAKDGQYRFLAWSNTLLYDDHGKVSYIIATAQDITEKRQVEDRLRVFEALVENAADGIGVTSLDGIVTYANPAYQAMILATDDLVGSQLIDSYNEEPDYLFRLVKQVLETGKWEGELSYKRQDGTIFPGQLAAFPLKDKDGNADQIAGIFRDITKQKQAESDLRTFKSIFDNASDAIAVTNAEATITYYNDAYRQLYRCDEHHMGQPISVVVAPEDQEHLPGILQEIIGDGEWKGQLLHIRHDGTKFPALETCFVIKNDAGELTEMVGFVRDISELVEAEEERTRLQEQVIEAQRESLRELSTPLLPLDQHVLVMPLIGTIDSSRAQLVMETLLEGIAQHQAEVVLVDITGVKVVDTQVAQALIRTAQAAQLLGAQVILTGIQPQIALTLVHLGADMNSIVTRSTIQRGIAYALYEKGVHREQSTRTSTIL
jgi:rsbT co-antagonist protein RsbR